MKNIRRIYLIICGGFIILLLFIATCFHRDVESVYTTEESMSREEYDASFDGKNTVSLQGVIGPSKAGDRYIVFFTGHQIVHVSIGGEKVYEVLVPDNLFGKTPGCGWNFVPVGDSQVGKEIEITLESVYAATSGRVPEIYYGSKYAIIKELLIRDIPSFIICGITVLVGVAILIYCLILKIKGNAGRNVLTLTYLGIFAMILGIWSGNEISSIAMVFGRSMFSTYLAYISLMLMVLPFMLFTRDMFANREHIIWKISCGISLADLIGTTLLQLFHIVDYRETLWCMHGTCIFFMIVVIYMTVKEAGQGLLTKEMKINVASLLLIIMGFVIDMVDFVSSGSPNIIGRVCFLAYIVILCYMFTRDIAALTIKGKEVEMYHKLAFTDALTGAWNRTAYSRRMAQYDQESLRQAQVFVMDLNNLKWCNDNMGHQLGDRYIIQSAAFIRDLFKEKAKVYRIGGDEFCVLASGMSMVEIQCVFDTLQETKIEVRSQGEDKIFYGRVACGFEKYRDGDEDIYQIAKRADEKMYEKKRQLKEKDG